MAAGNKKDLFFGQTYEFDSVYKAFH